MSIILFLSLNHYLFTVLDIDAFSWASDAHAIEVVNLTRIFEQLYLFYSQSVFGLKIRQFPELSK